MATGRRNCLQHHWGLYYLEHCLSHLRDEERVRENWWYEMSLFFEETLLVTKVQVGRQPHSFWCLNLLLLNSGDCFTHGCGPGMASAITGGGGRITLPGDSHAKAPQQSLQEAREEIALDGPVCCQTNHDEQNDLRVSERFTTQ